MDDAEDAARAALLSDLLRMQQEMETALAPPLVEPMLTLRLTMQQLKVLAILSVSPDGMSMQSIATSLGVSLATISGIVDRLEAQGMAARGSDPRDLRVRRVVTTQAGRDVMRQLAATRPQLDEAALRRLTVEDLRALNQGIAALLRVSRELATERHLDAEG
ncbi:MarR family winged helix-turn-helix transcriptional regulator [Microbacterium phosphatis]|uniref:MarR family winged helix-turn-helix transcriptional regulator n=1 Tax=Microbacterium phosphatis TaxID=3140248 RepID=UPI0031409E0C